VTYWRGSGETNPLLATLVNGSNVARDCGLFSTAILLREHTLELGPQELTPRSIHTARLFKADCHSLMGEHEAALGVLDEHLEGFRALKKVQDGDVVTPASVWRRAGKLSEALAYLDEVAAASWLGAYDPAFICEERARLAAAAKDWRSAQRLRREANQLFSALGMDKRSTEDPALDTGQLFARPRKADIELRQGLAAEAQA
jgi:hypothetical protein